MKKFGLLLFIFILVYGCSKEKKSINAAGKMQQFVIDIAQYARSFDPDFIIIPQNGIELAYSKTDSQNGFCFSYLDVVDGFGVEELFYDGVYNYDAYRLLMLQQLKMQKKVLVSEYVSNNGNIADAIQRNYNEGFICFVRNSENYHYWQIPDTVPYENENDITNLALAQNFLYLINSDNFSTKQAMINAIASTNFDVVLIDLFFNDTEFTSAEIEQLKTKSNGGKRLVISYISIGSAEKFRYYWKNDWRLHNPRWIKKKYEGYDDEYWVQFWDKEWQDIIFGNELSYMRKILNAGFDGAYLDNVEAYYFLYHND